MREHLRHEAEERWKDAREALANGDVIGAERARRRVDVLERNADVIQRHPVIVRRAAPARSPSLPTRAFQVFFLTMLVGAGGNAGNQAAVRIIRGLAVGAVVPGENRGGHQIFNPTSMCAHATVSTQRFLLCFENSMRAIDSSKNQPNRLRFDRDREV